MDRYFIIHKPFDVLSQFTREEAHHTCLADVFSLPPDIYPVGRLDRDSEGLLLLTNDKRVNSLLLQPRRGHERTYYAQVEGIPDQAALEKLREGVKIRIKKKEFRTRPASARLLPGDFAWPERTPPIRYRKTVPTAWLELKLTEGKNRQVRRMCAAVGFPVLRLVRVAIADLELGELPVGGQREIPREQFWQKLGITPPA
jgi:23S rRNA pseudouridine2457 synthase